MHFKRIILSQEDIFLIICHIPEAVKQPVISERKTARETAMGEAENLPVETSIAILVRIEVQNEIKRGSTPLPLRSNRPLKA